MLQRLIVVCSPTENWSTVIANNSLHVRTPVRSLTSQRSAAGTLNQQTLQLNPIRGDHEKDLAGMTFGSSTP